MTRLLVLKNQQRVNFLYQKLANSHHAQCQKKYKFPWNLWLIFLQNRIWLSHMNQVAGLLEGKYQHLRDLIHKPTQCPYPQLTFIISGFIVLLTITTGWEYAKYQSWCDSLQAKTYLLPGQRTLAKIWCQSTVKLAQHLKHNVHIHQHFSQLIAKQSPITTSVHCIKLGLHPVDVKQSYATKQPGSCANT